jgi:uncharacterized repeat protein (TIGR03803 family)
LRFTRRLLIALYALVLVSCEHAGNFGLPAARNGTVDVPDAAGGYKQIFAFRGTPSGSGPTGMILVKGALYGTTTSGGARTLGTFFVRGSSGKVRILHSFQGGSDGAQPEGALVELNGVFYGTTEYGGSSGDGTVFAITPAGKEHVVYSFKGGSDGATPVLAGLAAVNGKLYGTTNAAGDTGCTHQSIVGCGTVFELTSSGQERVLYRFKGADGACPSGTLIASGGTLYGTTNFGGRYDLGSVFKITTAGKESAIYSFRGYPDGVAPYGGLTELNGTFYGTTTLGGAFQGSGTVFEISVSGNERILHSFRGTPDGALPYATLTVAGNALYGTTELGGSSSSACVGHGIVGCGTIFRTSTSGNLSLLYKFKGRKDGSWPLAGVISAPNSLLYGTTLGGGVNDNGTIFRLAE